MAFELTATPVGFAAIDIGVEKCQDVGYGVAS